MTINDKIYGRAKITEPVLLELLESPSILRLKNISQFGIPDKYYHFENYNRYEHSVGVMILLRELGATLEEQVAGILHDVSVLAFSHIADWVFGAGDMGIENYHDEIHEKFVKKTEIPKILDKYDFVLNRILNEECFSLLEKEAPDLCADRVDYALREFKYWLNPKIVDSCLEGLVNYNGEIVFSSEKTAFDFATNYLELQTQHWGSFQSITRYHLFSKALKIALDKKILSESDFYKNEEFVLGKLEKIQDNDVEKILKVLKDKELKGFISSSGKRIVKKFRYTNPKVISGNKLTRLSELNLNFKEVIEKHRRISRKGIII